ncbi:MAG TPA: class E sortase [Marmoricola sp.]|nr:class E sortase [Marmoricola sp.]
MLPLAAVLAAAVACSGTPAETAETAEPAAETSSPATPSSTPTPSPTPSTTSPTPTPTPSSTPTAPEPRRSFVTIPALGVRDVPTVRYRGRPDDGPGTAIQDTGAMASPRGPRGGVGPGVVGNFIITGHRTSHGAPLAELPALERGEGVLVRSGDQVFVYRIVGTRETSFRSAASLARQSAPVPGHPGRDPVRPMLTLSTCATPEDNAAGNFWRDEFGNPEHRIDKIGVLADVRPARRTTG